MMAVRVDQLSSYYVLSPPLGNEGISLFVNLLHVNIRARLVGPLTLHGLSHRQLFIQFAKSLSVLSLFSSRLSTGKICMCFPRGIKEVLLAS